MELSDLQNRFTHHPPRDHEQADKYAEIRRAGYAMAFEVNNLAPDSREKSLAITRIEEAVMWANAAIARNEQ